MAMTGIPAAAAASTPGTGTWESPAWMMIRLTLRVTASSMSATSLLGLFWPSLTVSSMSGFFLASATRWLRHCTRMGRPLLYWAK